MIIVGCATVTVIIVVATVAVVGCATLIVGVILAVALIGGGGLIGVLGGLHRRDDRIQQSRRRGQRTYGSADIRIADHGDSRYVQQVAERYPQGACQIHYHRKWQIALAVLVVRK